MERLKINLRRANPSRKTNAASCDTAPCPTEALLPVATATHAPCSTEYSREILNVRYTITTLKTHSSVFRNLSDEIDSEFEILRVADQALCIYTKARMYVFTWLYFERYCTCATKPDTHTTATPRWRLGTIFTLETSNRLKDAILRSFSRYWVILADMYVLMINHD